MTQENIVYAILIGIVIIISFKVFKAFSGVSKAKCDNCNTSCELKGTP